MNSHRLCSRCRLKPITSSGQYYCADCKAETARTYGASSAGKAARRRAHLKRQTKCRQYVFDYLAHHPCADCGESDLIVLEFDHVRGIKKKSVMELVGPGSLTSLKAEIEKCDVVCANCHTRRTYVLDAQGFRIRAERNLPSLGD